MFITKFVEMENVGEWVGGGGWLNIIIKIFDFNLIAIPFITQDCFVCYKYVIMLMISLHFSCNII